MLPYNKLDPIPPSECYVDWEWDMVMTVFVSKILNIRIDYVGLGRIFYLVIIPGFKPIVSDEFPRGTLDSLMWKEHMEIEYFDQWGMETHEWRFKRKYWLFGPWVGYLNGEKVGENSQILWQKYLLKKYDPFN